MKKCQNPECKKQIPENMDYCGEACLKRHIELRKGKQTKPTVQAPFTKYENQILKESKGLRVELIMSRGPPVRGILVSYDPEFQKVTIKEDLGNNQMKTTIVKLSYVSSLSVYSNKGDMKP